MNKKLEEIPDIKNNLFVRFKKEKVEELEANKLQNIINVRAIENTTLFNIKKKENQLLIEEYKSVQNFSSSFRERR